MTLEDQVLIAEDGFENLTRFPFDARLLGCGQIPAIPGNVFRALQVPC